MLQIPEYFKIDDIYLYVDEFISFSKNIPDKSIDVIITDPPYGSTANHWDKIVPFDMLWEVYNRIIKDNGAIIMFGTGLFAYKLGLSNEKGFKHEIIWYKSKSGSAFTAKFRPVSMHENILVFTKSGESPNYYPQLTIGEPYKRVRKENKGNKPNNHKLGVVSLSETVNDGFRYPHSVQFFQQKWRRQDQLHPTEKPVELMEWIIKSYSKEGDLVLDSFGGSCPVAKAAYNTNRKCLCVDKEEEYIIKGISRF